MRQLNDMKPFRVLLVASILSACPFFQGCSKKLEQETQSLRNENHRLIEEKAEANAKVRLTEDSLKSERERHASEIVKAREEGERPLRSLERKVAELQSELGDLHQKLRVADAELAKKALQLDDLSKQKQESEDTSRLQIKLADLDVAMALLEDVWRDTQNYRYTFNDGFNRGEIASNRLLFGETYAENKAAEARQKANAAEESWKRRYSEAKIKLWELTKQTLTREDVRGVEDRMRAIYEKLYGYFYSGLLSGPTAGDGKNITESIAAVKSDLKAIK